MTFKELDETANQLAHILVSAGIKPDSFVGISFDRSIPMVLGALATLKAGGAYIPIEPSLPKELSQYMLDDAKPGVVITTSGNADKLKHDGTQQILIDTDIDYIKKQSTEKPPVEVKPDNLAYVIYTSGTTGKRKGALIEHKSLANAYFAWEDAYGISPKDNVLQTASFAFDVFTGDWVRTLCAGAKLVINPYNLILAPDNTNTGPALYELMRDKKITVAEFTPPVLRNLLRYAKTQKEALDFMRLLMVGADAWYMGEHRELVEYTKRQTRVADSYGMTEATVDSTFYEQYGLDKAGDRESLIGKPFNNAEAYVIDEEHNIVPIGEIGELCIAGIGLARGYHNRPELTQSRFVKVELPDGNVKRMYHSGDLARFKNDGNIEFLGRKDYQVEIRSIRVELGEVEAAIQQDLAVQENTVVVTGEGDNQRLICFMLSNEGKKVDLDQLKKDFLQKLPGYMLPAEFHVVDSMPLTSNGKTDRKALTKLAENEAHEDK